MFDTPLAVFRRVLDRLTAPHPAITSPEDRDGARLFAILMVAQVVVVFAVLLALNLVPRADGTGSHWRDADTILILAATALLAVPYALLRAGRYRTSVPLYIALTAAVPLSAPFLRAPNVEIGTLATVMLPTILASFFYPTQGAAIVLAGTLGIAAVRIAVTPLPAGHPLTASIILVAVALSGSLAIVSRRRYMIQERARVARQRASEMALEERSEGYRVLLDSSLDVLLGTDRDGIITYIGGAFEATTGHRVADRMGRPVFDLVLLADADRVRREFDNLLVERAKELRTEWRLARPDGRIIWLEALGTNRLGYLGLDSIVISLRDVSPRRQAEAERARLEGQVQEVARMETVGRLAGGVAHDFNNLLTVILANIDMAEREMETAPGPRQRLGNVRRASRSAAALVRRLLAFSRREPVAPRAVDLNAEIGGLRDILEGLTGETVNLTLRLRYGIGAVFVDPSVVERTVVNLAINARDAMPDGGTLTVTTHEEELSPGATGNPLARPGRFVVLTVADTGCGMTEEVKARLFEPFFTTKPQGSGTGLGLSTVYGAVRQAEGWIEVESEPGRGATFRVYLPRVPGAAAAAAVPAPGEPATPAAAGHETILYAEDNAPLREVTSEYLAHAGYRVLAAGDGPGALELAARHPGPIHLLFTDTVMPGMSGPGLAAALALVRPGVPVLFTSGYTDEERLTGTAPGGPGDFLAKPYLPDELAVRIRKILAAAKA
ncbi:MAG: ATP-binding protein [Candidatus Coatesbacteria bacterium]